MERRTGGFKGIGSIRLSYQRLRKIALAKQKKGPILIGKPERRGMRPIVISTKRSPRENEKEVDFMFLGKDGPKHPGKLILKGGTAPAIILNTEEDAPVQIIKSGRKEKPKN